MQGPLNRAQFRDAIRHNLRKRRAVDLTPPGRPGDPAPNNPFPPNSLINDKLDEAISLLTQETGFAETVGVSIPVAIGTATPQILSLWTAGVNNTPALHLGQINDVRRVYWDDGTTKTRLRPIARDEQDRRNRQYQSEGTGTPTEFSVDGQSLSLYPGASVAGTLYLICGTGILGFVTDGDTIEQLPTDYHLAVQYLATALLAGSETEDVEMQSAAQYYTGLAQRTIQNVKKWVNRKNVEQQRTLSVRATNQYYGRR